MYIRCSLTVEPTGDLILFPRTLMLVSSCPLLVCMEVSNIERLMLDYNEK
jgi:hypothetical protein